MKSIVFIAAPAAGKGTQSEQLSKKYKLPHISTGDLLRDSANDNSELSIKIRQIMENGELISDELVTKLLVERLKKSDCKEGYILDGFPRSLEQALLYEELLGKKPNYVILLEIDKDTAMKRSVGRLSCPNCHSIFNTLLSELKPINENICDHCNTTLIKRKDDNIESFEHRYQTYLNTTLKVVDYYEKQGNLYRIDSSKSKEETIAKIYEVIDSRHYD